jgi:hypothetical protein
MENATRQHQFVHAEIDMMIIGKARNMLVQAGYSQPGYRPDVFWFIDQDVFVPAHAGILIDQALELGIVSGLYFSRRLPYTPQLYRRATEENLKGMYWPLMEYPDNGLAVVDAVGGGCLAVRRDVIERMQSHFNERLLLATSMVEKAVSPDPTTADQFQWLMTYLRSLSPWFEFLDRKGEDLYFCERARNAGYVVWANTGVKCSHLGDVEVHEGHFLFMKANNLLKVVPVGEPGAEGVALEFGLGGGPAPMEVKKNERVFVRIARSAGETVERGDDLQLLARRIGVGSRLSSTVLSA